MEPKCSLSCSQQPSTGPYILILIIHVHFLRPYLFKIRINIILPPIEANLQSGLLSSSFPNRTLYYRSLYKFKYKHHPISCMQNDTILENYANLKLPSDV